MHGFFCWRCCRLKIRIFAVMNAVQELYDRVSKLDDNRLAFLVFSDSEIQDLVITLNRDKQLFNEGVNTSGDIVGYYSLATELISKGKKRFNEKYNFKDTGALFKSFTADVNSNDDLVIRADTLKQGEDIDIKYNNIIGLTDESLQILRIKAKEIIVREFRKVLFQ